jgi:hypothetical protein
MSLVLNKMHEPYENDIPDDPYKFYFQIDTEWIKKYMDSLLNKIEYKWITKDIIEDALKNLPQYKVEPVDGFPFVSLPVNDYFSNTAGDKTSLYLGNNQYNEGIWKIKYFVYNKLQKEYELHLQSHAKHVVSQPRYYESLFEILN